MKESTKKPTQAKKSKRLTRVSSVRSTEAQQVRLIKTPLLALAFIFVLFVSGVGAIVLAAKQLGQNTPFAVLAQVLPVETMPGVKYLTLPPTELVKKGIGQSSSLAFYRQLNGLDYSIKADVSVAGLANELPFTAKGNLKELISLNKDLTQYKELVSMGGKAEAGAIGFDPGEEAIKMEILQPDFKDIFFKINLSSPLLHTLKSTTPQTTFKPDGTVAREPAVKFDDYLDTYLHLNVTEYMQFMSDQLPASSSAKIHPVDPAKLSQAYLTLYEKLQPDLSAMAASTVGDLSRYAQVKYGPRTKVSGKWAVVVTAKVDSAQFADVSWEFVSKLPEVFKNHRQDLLDYCKETAMIDGTRNSCDEVFSDEQFSKLFTDNDNYPVSMSAFGDKYRNSVRHLHFDHLEFTVNPLDGSLLRTAVTVSIDKDGFNQLLSDLKVPPVQRENFELTQFSLSYVGEELKRRTGFVVTPPAESINLVEKIKNYVEAQKRQMQEMQSVRFKQKTYYR